MKSTYYAICLAGLALSSLPVHCEDVAQKKEIVIFAAASTAQAIDAIKSSYEAKHPDIKIRTSYGASAILARQISKGAPADLFLSANISWINWLKKNKAGISKPLIATHNHLVLITPKNSGVKTCPQTEGDLEKTLGNKRFVIADPNVSPLGQYSKNMLIEQGLWETVKDRLAIAGNATMAVKMIERGAAPYGIAYTSGVVHNKAIRSLCLLKYSLDNPINYYIAQTKSPSPQAEAFIHYILNDSDKYWKEAGFGVLPQIGTDIPESK